MLYWKKYFSLWKWLPFKFFCSAKLRAWSRLTSSTSSATSVFETDVVACSSFFLSVELFRRFSNASLLATSWKKTTKIYFHTINNPSIVVHTFARHVLTSLTVDKILLPRYMKWSTNFEGLPLQMKMVPSCLKYMISSKNYDLYRLNRLAFLENSHDQAKSWISIDLTKPTILPS